MLIKKPKNFLELTDTVTRLYNKKYSFEKIVFRHCSHLTLQSEIPVNWTLDGEYAGSFASVEIEVIENAIDTVRPAEIRTKPLFVKKLP